MTESLQSPRPALTLGARMSIESALTCVEQMRVYSRLALARMHFANQVANLDPHTSRIMAHLEAVEAHLVRLDAQIAALAKGEELPE